MPVRDRRPSGSLALAYHDSDALSYRVLVLCFSTWTPELTRGIRLGVVSPPLCHGRRRSLALHMAHWHWQQDLKVSVQEPTGTRADPEGRDTQAYLPVVHLKSMG